MSTLTARLIPLPFILPGFDAFWRAPVGKIIALTGEVIVLGDRPANFAVGGKGVEVRAIEFDRAERGIAHPEPFVIDEVDVDAFFKAISIRMLPYRITGSVDFRQSRIPLRLIESLTELLVLRFAVLLIERVIGRNCARACPDRLRKFQIKKVRFTDRNAFTGLRVGTVHKDQE